MIPVIAIVGQPNVGKSTLFNYLTHSRSALVFDEPGSTRDRQYGEGCWQERPFIVIDTGGVEKNPEGLQGLMMDQTWQAVEEAQLVFWVVNARHGLGPTDHLIVEKLRGLSKPIYIVVNKSDGLDPQIACSEFYVLGLPLLFPIAATQGRGVGALLESALAHFPTPIVEADIESEDSIAPIKIAVIGKPNVGKSTLVNRILGEERVLVYDAPGTTRDSIYIPFERRGQEYVLIDTAGVRRRRSIDNELEKFSVVKTLQAITASNVVVFIIDARQNVAEQDLHLLGFIIESGKALVIVVNKWDGLREDARGTVRRALDRRLQFVAFARIHYISALHGSGVGELFPAINQAYHSATKKLPTPKLTSVLEQAIEAHQPPAVLGRRIKLRYAHAGGYNPPVVVIHGNQTDALPASYMRYLENFFRKTLGLVGTPIKIELRSGDNPYKDCKNVLTERQVKRRKRLMDHVKKKSK